MVISTFLNALGRHHKGRALHYKSSRLRQLWAFHCSPCRNSVFFIIFLLISSFNVFGQTAKFTSDDTLRGSITPQRAWWDLQHYALKLNVNPSQKFIKGSNTITYKVLSTAQELQIDLQPPMIIDSIMQSGIKLKYRKQGKNAYFISLKDVQALGTSQKLTVYFQGKPTVAKRAPWDGGFSWSKDKAGDPFVATSCQGLGASVWWPCKDHMYDEVDSMRITVTAPDSLFNVSNGRLASMCIDDEGNRTTEWVIKNPINNYGVNVNIAHYEHYKEIFPGEKGPLTLDYYVLPENLDKAHRQFNDVLRTIKAFEHWFGPYPFYEDGYKLVEVPYLGMEHQSCVTYGNKYQNGYLGRDLSGSGWGLKWDFIIVHESGHEWFANNITYKDMADMWIHESFTNYSETLFTEYYYGIKAGQEYVIGTRSKIQNDKPIIAKYHVNDQGSSDMYYKGGNMIHTIRHIINNDDKFRTILRGLNSNFYHQTVTTKQIEDYISTQAGIDFSKVFDQYLRDVRIPKLAYKIVKKSISYRWENVVEGFNMPLKVDIDGKTQFINPGTAWKKIAGKSLKVDPNFYIIQ